MTFSPKTLASASALLSRLRRRFSRRRQGFALPAVLAVVGVVTIIFLVAMTALHSLTLEAGAARARVRFLQQALTAEAVAGYMMATEPMAARGVAVGTPRQTPLSSMEEDGAGSLSANPQVLLDDRPYLLAGSANVIIQLQDQAGMINLAGLNPGQTQRLFEKLGTTASYARRFQPRFEDYLDPDDLRRTEGAERSDYPPGTGPANRELRRADEWLSILGARDGVTLARWRALRNRLAVDHTAPQLNVNTASREALEVLFGASPQQAEAAIRQREATPFTSFAALASVLGGDSATLDPDILYTFPSGRMMLTVRDTTSPWIYRSRISLTPSNLERPMWIDQADMVEAPRRQAAETQNVPRLPYTPH